MSKLNTLNPNSRLELHDCVSVSAEVILIRNSIKKHLAIEGYSGWTHSIAARTTDNALYAPRKDFTP